MRSVSLTFILRLPLEGVTEQSKGTLLKRVGNSHQGFENNLSCQISQISSLTRQHKCWMRRQW